MRTAAILVLLLAGCATALDSSTPSATMPPPIPTLREQEAIRQEWLRLRLERVLPELLRKHGIAMWIVNMREYNEDPVFFSLASPSTFAARRRTILVFFDRGEEGIERLALGGGSNGGLYNVYRDPEVENRELWGEGQWAMLRRLVQERNPRNIAINISHTHAFSDGLSAGERELLERALEPWKDRLIHAENLPLEYIETRLPEMLPTYRHLMRISHALIARAFSNEVIQPGVTTTEDVVWWLREQLRMAGLDTWFQPSVDLQRRGGTARSPISPRQDSIIQRGDVLHVDFGIKAMGLATDTQHMGYVLDEGETDVPAGIKAALARSNRLQDLLLMRMKPGRTGNDVLIDTLEAMRAEGIDGTIYTHPIGDHGHGAGPLIGLWDRQQAIPGRGEPPLIRNSWFAIELQATSRVPEWDGQPLRSMQEEDAVLNEDGTMSWILNRQTEYHIVR
jgi:Xaa-Pro aminopeptidase